MRPSAVLVAAVALLALFAGSASADCVSDGLAVNSACSSYISQIKAAQPGLPCGSLSNPAPGTVANLVSGVNDANLQGCCAAAQSFFSAGCSCRPNIINLASSLYGLSADQLLGATKAAVVKCGVSTGGCAAC